MVSSKAGAAAPRKPAQGTMSRWWGPAMRWNRGAVSSTRGARPSSTDVDPPGRRFADPGGHLVAELNRHTLHLEGMLRELLALLGEGLLLFGAHLGTRRAHAAGRYGVGSVPGPRARQCGEARVELTETLLGRPQIALERVPAKRYVGGEGGVVGARVGRRRERGLLAGGHRVAVRRLAVWCVRVVDTAGGVRPAIDVVRPHRDAQRQPQHHQA